MSCSNPGQMIIMKFIPAGLLTKYVGRLLKKGIILLFMLVLLTGGGTWLRNHSDVVDNVVPSPITNEAVIEKLYSEGTLNVLEAMGRVSYQVEDPGIIDILNKKISIPGLQKTVTVKYEYKIHLGVDLTRLTADDVTMTETSVLIVLPRPEMVSIEPYNDRAQTTGGFLTYKAKPREDLVEMSDQDEYINILRDFALQDLQESGKYQKLQQAAMDNAVDLLTRLLREMSPNNDLEVVIQFK